MRRHSGSKVKPWPISLPIVTFHCAVLIRYNMRSYDVTEMWPAGFIADSDVLLDSSTTGTREPIERVLDVKDDKELIRASSNYTVMLVRGTA